MGRSDDPRDAKPAPVGTNADPAIRQSDEKLISLVDRPDRTGPKTPSDLTAGSDLKPDHR